jgi:hypothetical protein
LANRVHQLTVPGAAMEAQQFHLKWNNHSLNTLSSFQQLLDTNTLVDVSLTCSNGKTVTAHRMVLAACSDYFYRLFKTLPEKHPVIVFKDAGEEIVRDLLLFMYKGEVEVQESYLNDFLKFADTLQVKGLTQSDRNEGQSMAAAVQHPLPAVSAHDLLAKGKSSLNNNINSPAKEQQPISLVKNLRKNVHTPPASLPLPPPPPTLPPPPPHIADMTKSYLANLTKFSPLLQLPADPSNPPDFMTQLSSPNLYRALQRKYPENPAFLKNMPLFKKMFGDNADQFAAAAAAFGFPAPPLPGHPMDDDGDSLSDRPTPPPPSHHATTDENGLERHGAMSPMDSDSPYPPSSGPESLSGDISGAGLGSAPGSVHKNSPLRGTCDKNSPLSKNKSSGRGSRLERMIAAEYKIISEYSDAAPTEVLPVMTPELMKSRRTHSLQLAIGEILHNRASVQSAATKYHIPRETLRRHYQRYLKAMGINKPIDPSEERATGSVDSLQSQSLATNNNRKNLDGSAPDDSANAFSSLMDIGQAFGIWNPDIDGSGLNKKAAVPLAGKPADADEKQKLVIDEDDGSDEEPLSPGGPEDEDVEAAAVLPVAGNQVS